MCRSSVTTCPQKTRKSSALAANHPIISHAFPYFPNLGVFPSNWKRHDTPDPSAYRNNFVNHLDRQDTSPTPFISISDSPARIIRFSKSEANVGENLEVLVIDAQKLHASGIPICRTTSMASALDIPRRLPRTLEGVEFITDSHWLVDWWIPKECIETEMDITDFEEFCKSRVYFNGTCSL